MGLSKGMDHPLTKILKSKIEILDKNKKNILGIGVNEFSLVED